MSPLAAGQRNHWSVRWWEEELLANELSQRVGGHEAWFHSVPRASRVATGHQFLLDPQHICFPFSPGAAS